ncbi:hypothetical protein MHYP_G00361970 [Metynnis hypsauchen]
MSFNLRAFPGIFQRSTGIKWRISQTIKVAKFGKVWKPFDFSLFLLPKQTDLTPSPPEELQYMQAGLGKQTFTMSEDMTHSEFSILVKKQFPKMDSLSGGWLLYKSTGGNGRRRLIVIPPDSEGYTGSTIRSATGGGKTTLYIAPLQEELDVTPLPNDAKEFALMPKEKCKTCNKMMPIQILILHVRDCSQTSSEEDKRNSKECSDEEEVEQASDLVGLIEPILGCGYTGPITSEHKEGIIRAMLLHATMRKAPMLRDIGEGLKLYKLLKVLQENPAVCTGLFLPGKENKPDANYLMLCLKPDMSPRGSTKEIWETQILNFFQDFLQEIEGLSWHYKIASQEELFECCNF